MDVFEIVADPVRRRILVSVAGGARSVSQLAAGERISRPAVSRHLRVLREAGILELQIRGRVHIHRLAPGALRPVEEWLAGVTAAAALPPAPAPRLGALDRDIRPLRERLAEQPLARQEVGTATAQGGPS